MNGGREGGAPRSAPLSFDDQVSNKVRGDTMGTYCDGCLTAVYDEGFYELEDQVAALDAASDTMPDHQCDKIDDPDAEIRCDCLAH